MAKNSKNVEEVVKPAKKQTRKSSKKVEEVVEAKTEEVITPAVEESAAHVFNFVEARAKIEAACHSYNELFQEEKYKEAAGLANTITEDVNTYVAAALHKCMTECKNTEDPMLEACKRYSYPIIAVKDTKDKDTGIVVKEVIDKEKQIDLQKLHQFCGGIGKDTNWIFMAEKLNFLMTQRLAEDIGVSTDVLDKLNNSYMMKEISKEIIFYKKSKDGKNVPAKDPVSNKSLQRTVNDVIMAMIGPDFRATTKDVMYLIHAYAKRSSKTKLTLVCPKHPQFRSMLLDICYHLVNGEHYNTEFQIYKK